MQQRFMKFLVQIRKKWKEDFWERKMVRVFVMLFLAGAVCLWDNSLYYPSRMPDIVFVIKTLSSEGGRRLFFIDNNGDCYYSDDAYVCNFKMNTEGQGDRDLIAEYVTGSLKDKIILCGKCDMEELYSNYKKLYQVSRNRNFRLEAASMTVGDFYKDEVCKWRGNYYTRRGEIQALEFHYSYSKITYEVNDERADEIYNWCKKKYK